MDVQERLSLEAVSAHTLESSEHVQRYEFAASLLEGRRVLDLCCGIGYGSVALARLASEVVGVDRDQAAIDTARVVAASVGNSRFVAQDAVSYLTECGAEFDAIVCFEGLEHLDRLEAAVEILLALAVEGCAFVLSVPNSKTFREENPFHVTDFGYDEALALFGRFPDPVILYQHVAEGTVISSDPGGELQAALALADHGEPEYANNFIACVNLDAARSPLTQARAFLTIAPWHNRYLKNLERANAEMWRANARLARARLGQFDSAAAATSRRLEDYRRRAEQAEALEEQLQAVWERVRVAEEHVVQQRRRADAAEARLVPKRFVTARAAVRKVAELAAARRAR